MESEQYQNGYYAGYSDYFRFFGVSTGRKVISTSKSYSDGYFQGWSDAMLNEDNGLSASEEWMDRRLYPPEWLGPKSITTTQSPATLGEKGNWRYGLR